MPVTRHEGIYMLKPIEVLIEIDESAGLAETEKQRRKQKLLEVLLNPMKPESDEAVHGVFAHGPEAVRVVTVPETSSTHHHWAVQAWNLGKERWITQKSYPMHHDPRGVLNDAACWYPPLLWRDTLSKWSGAANAGDSNLGNIFSSKTKLAEFWYETTAVEYGINEASSDRHGDRPWSFLADLAHTVFVSCGIPDPAYGEAYRARLATQVAHLAKGWGEPAGQTLTAVEQSQASTYKISVNYERWYSDDDREFGLPQNRGVLLDQVIIDAAELKVLASIHHINAISASAPAHSPCIWFYSNEPVSSGINADPLLQQFNSLHIHCADNRNPEASDYKIIADLIGVAFVHHSTIKSCL